MLTAIYRNINEVVSRNDLLMTFENENRNKFSFKM